MSRKALTKYRISEIRLDWSDDLVMIPQKIAHRLKVDKKKIQKCEIIRQSIDARRKPKVQLVHTVDFLSPLSLNLPIAKERTYLFPKVKFPKNKKIIVVGFGPCGIFAALLLAQLGYCPIVIERGKDIDSRTRDVNSFWAGGKILPDSNVQFGEGGAGTFSDGKLTTGIHDARIYKVLSEFHRFGAADEILYKHRAHIGTDVLKPIIKNIREEIKRLGGQVLFETKLTDFRLQAETLQAIEIERRGQKELIPCDKLILAVGHSARDTFRQCYAKRIQLSQKAFSIGTRIQHPQKLIDFAQYGDGTIAEKLGAAEYRLNAKSRSGRGVYTFCMCPGGEVILASSGLHQVLSNGMSYHARDGEFANSALLVDVRTSDFHSSHVLAGVAFQEHWEKKAYEIKRKYQLLQSDIENFKASDLAQAMPDFASKAILEILPVFDRRIDGFGGSKALLLGPETRSSSPVRFFRDENFESNIKNIYPAGEGAGYAGGIMSAAVDGIKVAEKIITARG